MARWSAEYRYLLARLKEAREAAGLTQVKAAAHLGRHQNFISRCESGERRVDAIELLDFARLYRKDLSFFLPEIPVTSHPHRSRR